MKTNGMVAVLMALAWCILAPLGLAAQYEAQLSMRNVRIVDNNKVVGELWMKSVGSSSLNLSETSIAIRFDSSKFTSPQCTFVPAAGQLTNFYTIVDTAIVQYSSALVDFIAPNISSQSQFNQRVLQISSVGNGTYLGEWTLSGLRSFVGTAGLVFSTSLPYRNQVTSFENTSPFQIFSAQWTASAFDIALGPAFSFSTSAPRVSGSDVDVDVSAQRTGGTEFFLASSTLRLALPRQVLSGAETFELVSPATGLAAYSPSVQLVSDSVMQISLSAPNTSDSASVVSQLYRVPDASTRLFTVRIKGLNDTVSVAALPIRWVAAGTVVRQRPLRAAWSYSNDVTAAGQFSVSAPQTSLQLSSVPPSPWCLGSTQRLSWTQNNIRSVAIEEITGQGTAVRLATVPGSAGGWDYAVAGATGERRFRIRDAGFITNASAVQAREVAQAASFVQQPSGVVQHCVGDTITFFVGYGGTPKPTVRWEQSGDGVSWSAAPFSGDTVVIRGVEAAANGRRYRAVLSNSCTASLPSTAIQLAVGQPPVITSAPVGVTVCEGSEALFVVRAVGEPQPAIQWQRRSTSTGTWQNIGGAVSDTLRLAAVTPSTDRFYRAVVSNRCGQVQTSQVELTVNTAPRITAQPATTVVCEGDSAVFQVSVTGIPSPSGRWEQALPGFPGWQTIAGAVEPRLVLRNLSTQLSGSSYRFRVANICGEAVSEPAFVGVRSYPRIAVQPRDAEACAGQGVQFTASATGMPLPTVRWERSTNGGNGWQTLLGDTLGVLSVSTVAASQDGHLYRAVFSTPCGDSATRAARLTVRTPPTIASHPSDADVCEGAAAIFTARADAIPAATFRWERLPVGSGIWTPIPGALGDTLRVESVGRNMHGTRYRVVVANQCGSATSQEAVLSVDYAPSIVEQPQSVTILLGGNAEFRVSVAPSRYGVASVQWYFEDTPLQSTPKIQGVRDTVLRITDVSVLEVSEKIRAVVSGPCGSDTSRSVAILIFTPELFIDGNPNNATRCEGDTVSFHGSAKSNAEGAVIQYRWWKDNEPLAESSRIRGVTTPTLTISDLRPGDLSSSYFLIASLPSLSISQRTLSAQLTVRGLPVVLEHPTALRGCPGSSGSLEVSARNARRYRWFKDGVPSGDTTAVIALTVGDGSLGRWWCQLEGDCGTVVSDTVEVTAESSVNIESLSADTTIRTDVPLTLSVLADKPELVTGYQWYKDGEAIVGATSPELVLPRILSDDAGEYYCVATAECGADTSAAIRVDVVVVGVQERMAGEQRVYPNPATDILTVDLGYTPGDFTEAVVADISGREVLRVRLESAITVLDVGRISAGVYTIMIRQGGILRAYPVAVVR